MALGAWVTPAGAQRWQTQYFYDKFKSTLVISDLQFPSASRGVAVGAITEAKHQKPVAVVTSDGGAHWQTVDLKDIPVSLYFLSENLGWMVTEHGLWQTTEAGKNWEKVPGLPPGIFRVYFTDEQNGVAVGSKKRVEETHDGGKHWTPLAAAAEPPGVPEHSAYNWVAFATPKYGIITGWNVPPRRMAQQFPDWMDPEQAMNRRDTPHLSYSLVTRDGGKTWKPNSASLFGDVSRVRFGPEGKGLGLIEYSNSFRYPAEAYKVDWVTGKSETVYRDKRFAISDIWLTPDGTAYLAGTLVAGQIRHVVPGKVQVLKSTDLTAWTEMPVDYRASANRTILAVVDENNMWMATDNGMILKMVK
ncbi:Glycosyl hydrolase, BNR repeat-containing protein [Candidatus Sulfopaludibacter sp. SbA4]|nr:Glycosyl hydrolase, BNR repeat-containing protein [Candidatus Sulfopaludibacter sp. SbA4]